MDKETYERMRPMIWAMFAMGVLAGRSDNANAANQADKMLTYFEQRFPVQPEAGES